MAKHIWLIYPCLKEFICASKIECNSMKKIRMKNLIKVNISLLKCWSLKDSKQLRMAKQMKIEAQIYSTTYISTPGVYVMLTPSLQKKILANVLGVT